jgi:hypothetical protein
MALLGNLSFERKQWLVQEAKGLGFEAVGVSKARFLNEEADRLEEWLKRGYQGEMGYLERNVDLRLDPRKLVPGAKTVVSLLFNYHNPDQPESPDAPRIASYAYGQDYHHVLKWKLKELMKGMKREWGDVEGRVFVDSAPVHERAWAAQSGLGCSIKEWEAIFSLQRSSWMWNSSQMLQQRIIVELARGALTLAQQVQSFSLRWSMDQNASATTRLNCVAQFPNRRLNNCRRGFLVVIFARRYVLGIDTLRVTRNRCLSRTLSYSGFKPQTGMK